MTDDTISKARCNLSRCQKILIVPVMVMVMTSLEVNVYGQLITPNAKQSTPCIIYNSHIGLLASGKNLDVVHANCPEHIKTIANLLANDDYHIIAVVPTNNGSEVYITNK